ncbi:hypothetical protein LSUE1_G009732 [Lachnellula suecica]|uniref:DUF7924 domain-containing protein n=1 Tax=Lachnellula suecica TaxID=602035 RepID=A0A8T9BYV1_9HELO|nr:hypothetical protein LSUE1_G009732 [Lachnellula suecica]
MATLSKPLAAQQRLLMPSSEDKAHPRNSKRLTRLRTSGTEKTSTVEKEWQKDNKQRKASIAGRIIQTRKRVRDVENGTRIERPTKRKRTGNRSVAEPNSPHLVKQEKKRLRREAGITPPPSRSRDGPGKRTQSPQRQPRKRIQTQDRSRPEQAVKRKTQELSAGLSHISPEPSSKRFEALVDQPAGVLQEARLTWWSEKGTWPTIEDELLDRFRSIVEDARAKKRSLSRKRSSGSMASSSSPSGSESRQQKCAPYRHQLFERQLKECGSFLDDHELGITPQSEKLCQQLLNGHQSTPGNTLFSDDNLLKKTCRRLKGENESKVVLRISELIVPSAEVLADQGAQHLSIIRESTNAYWALSVPFINPPGTSSGSRSGPRPQPDSAKAFDRDAFDKEQLRKLQPYLGDLLTESSFFAATFQMYFPIFTCEIKCGDGELDVADRQNAYSQSVLLLGLYKLFQLAGREQELHREINGFSVSHDERHARIYGHYLFINGNEVQIHRHLISEFIFAPSGEGDQRWKAYKFVKNVYDLWLPKHFERLCTVIDMLPEVSDAEQELSSLRSGLSQQFEDQILAGANEIPDSQPSAQQITPEATVRTGSTNNSKGRKKT